MKGFSIYYIEAMIACMLFFLVLLIHNHYNLDRQEKQIKLDRALVAFILYFFADCFWAAMVDGLIPKTQPGVLINTFCLYSLMAAICYFWLEYVMAVEQLKNRNRLINRFAVLFPFLLTTAVLIINYIAAPQTLLNDDLEIQSVYSIYLMFTPIVYLVTILFYTLKRAAAEENPAEKRRHIFIGMLPLSTLAAGMTQELFFPYIPIYCFVDALLILVFYIQSIEARVSLDPLTNLNNRGELTRYTSQKSNIYQDNRITVVMMMDINDFKIINDTYGHAEGDRALVIIADSMKNVVRGYSMPAFLGRYGGDEFILIICPTADTDIDQLVREIRGRIEDEISRIETPYVLSFSIGYDELKGKEDTMQDCMHRADMKLYQDKERYKKGR